MFYQLFPLVYDQRHQTLDVSLVRMLLFVASWQSQHLLVNKNKNQKKNQHEMASDQTNVRLNPPLIRPFPGRGGQTEATPDQTSFERTHVPGALELHRLEQASRIRDGRIRGSFKRTLVPIRGRFECSLV